MFLLMLIPPWSNEKSIIINILCFRHRILWLHECTNTDLTVKKLDSSLVLLNDCTGPGYRVFVQLFTNNFLCVQEWFASVSLSKSCKSVKMYHLWKICTGVNIFVPKQESLFSSHFLCCVYVEINECTATVFNLPQTRFVTVHLVGAKSVNFIRKNRSR